MCLIEDALEFTWTWTRKVIGVQAHACPKRMKDSRTKGETDYGQKGERIYSLNHWNQHKSEHICWIRGIQMEHVSNVHSKIYTQKSETFRCVFFVYLKFSLCDAKNRPVRFYCFLLFRFSSKTSFYRSLRWCSWLKFKWLLSKVSTLKIYADRLHFSLGLWNR